jgi:hypothetical protein
MLCLRAGEGGDNSFRKDFTVGESWSFRMMLKLQWYAIIHSQLSASKETETLMGCAWDPFQFISSLRVDPTSTYLLHSELATLDAHLGLETLSSYGNPSFSLAQVDV